MLEYLLTLSGSACGAEKASISDFRFRPCLSVRAGVETRQMADGGREARASLSSPGHGRPGAGAGRGRAGALLSWPAPLLGANSIHTAEHGAK